MGEHRVLEVFCFNRKTELRAGKKRVWRRHVIDTCQALGLTSAYKYERPFGDSRDVATIHTGVSLVRLFSLVRFADPALRARTAASLLDWLLFNTVIGNTDAHGKTFSFFVGKDGLSDAPWYDLVSVLQVDGVSHSLAMAAGDDCEQAASGTPPCSQTKQQRSVETCFTAGFRNKLVFITLKPRNALGAGALPSVRRILFGPGFGELSLLI